MCGRMCTILETSHTGGGTHVTLLPLLEMHFAYFKNIPSVSCFWSCATCFTQKCENSPSLKTFSSLAKSLFPISSGSLGNQHHAATPMWFCTDVPGQADTLLGPFVRGPTGARSRVHQSRSCDMLVQGSGDNGTRKNEQEAQQLRQTTNPGMGATGIFFFYLSLFVFFRLIICFLFSNSEAVCLVQLRYP